MSQLRIAVKAASLWVRGVCSAACAADSKLTSGGGTWRRGGQGSALAGARSALEAATQQKVAALMSLGDAQAAQVPLLPRIPLFARLLHVACVPRFLPCLKRGGLDRVISIPETLSRSEQYVASRCNPAAAVGRAATATG